MFNIQQHLKFVQSPTRDSLSTERATRFSLRIFLVLVSVIFFGEIVIHELVRVFLFIVREYGAESFDSILIHRSLSSIKWHEAFFDAFLLSLCGSPIIYLLIIRPLRQLWMKRDAAEDEIKRLAFYDPLTQLPNRRLLDDRLQQIMAHSQRSGDISAICLLDLDGFKHVNDTLGHEAGDLLLCEVALRLKDCVRQEDTIARLGGDEFALVLGGFKKIVDCELALSRIVTGVEQPYTINKADARVSASLGVSLFPKDGEDANLLLRNADQAMYEAKRSGKNRYHLFDATHGQRHLAKQTTIRKINTALAGGEIVLYYQPIVDCRQGIVVGVEALARWIHPVLGMLMPSEFIAVIEHDDIAVVFNEWVISQVIRDKLAWRQAGIELKVGINIFAQQFLQDGFFQHLCEIIIREAGNISDAAGLMLEIPETFAMKDVTRATPVIQSLHSIGVEVVLDDFGASNISLLHLKRLITATLKIDSSLVAHILTQTGDLAAIDGLIKLAKVFGLNVIAKGVESNGQVLMLLDLGCDMMQGYAFARPMPVDLLIQWLAQFSSDPLWTISGKDRPSREYFDLLLIEANHGDWIDRAIANYSASGDDVSRQNLENHRQCSLGCWQSDWGESFGDIEEFGQLDDIHRQVHQTATLLGEQRYARHLNESYRTEALLLIQQRQLADHLRRLRGRLPQPNPGNHKGEKQDDPV